jgi:hypothetical protein
MVSSKIYVLLRKKGLTKKKNAFDKRQMFNHDEINVLPRGRGLTRKYKSFVET